MDEEKSTIAQQATPDDAAIQQFFTELFDRLEQQKKGLDIVYANNARFEVSAWDLKIFFGQLNQRAGPGEVDLRTTVTIPWATAKIMDYFLRLNIAYYENNFGPINLPSQVTPPAMVPSDEQLADPKTAKLFEIYRKIHAEVFGS
jgi:hypothetical protein